MRSWHKYIADTKRFRNVTVWSVGYCIITQLTFQPLVMSVIRQGEKIRQPFMETESSLRSSQKPVPKLLYGFPLHRRPIKSYSNSAQSLCHLTSACQRIQFLKVVISLLLFLVNLAYSDLIHCKFRSSGLLQVAQVITNNPSDRKEQCSWNAWSSRTRRESFETSGTPPTTPRQKLEHSNLQRLGCENLRYRSW